VGGFAIIPILGEHVDDQLRTPGSLPPDAPAKDAFDHELDDKPQPYFPADEPASEQKQS
jgi:hypothetical protein